MSARPSRSSSHPCRSYHQQHQRQQSDCDETLEQRLRLSIQIARVQRRYDREIARGMRAAMVVAQEMDR